MRGEEKSGVWVGYDLLNITFLATEEKKKRCSLFSIFYASVLNHSNHLTLLTSPLSWKTSYSAFFFVCYFVWFAYYILYVVITFVCIALYTTIHFHFSLSAVDRNVFLSFTLCFQFYFPCVHCLYSEFFFFHFILILFLFHFILYVSILDVLFVVITYTLSLLLKAMFFVNMPAYFMH